MKNKISIIMTTFQRKHLLAWGLLSIARQNIPYEFEIIIVNDALEDGTREICNQYIDKLNIEYIFSGQRNMNGNIKWRVPGFAINIGVKKSSGNILIISCAEMYHLNNVIQLITEPVKENSKIIGIPKAWDDRDGSFLEQITDSRGSYDSEILSNYPELDTYLPFLMAVNRDEFYNIGGYDEDFIGFAFDDNDFVERLQLNGCNYMNTDGKAVHLYHPRFIYGKEDDPKFLYNKRLYFLRKGRVIRNKNREWGKI